MIIWKETLRDVRNIEKYQNNMSKYNGNKNSNHSSLGKFLIIHWIWKNISFNDEKFKYNII